MATTIALSVEPLPSAVAGLAAESKSRALKAIAVVVVEKLRI
jgi:hypothetical protein